MKCTFLTKDIVCNRSVKGIEPIAYILPFEGLNVVIDDVTGDAKLIYNTNQSTFSTIHATKFALNAGSSVVSSDVKENGFKHTFTAILAQVANGDLDKMDGIAVIVKYLSRGNGITQRLGHFFLIHLYHAGVHPVINILSAMCAARLSNFIFMMREHQIRATAMNIKMIA